METGKAIKRKKTGRGTGGARLSGNGRPRDRQTVSTSGVFRRCLCKHGCHGKVFAGHTNSKAVRPFPHLQHVCGGSEPKGRTKHHRAAAGVQALR